MNLENILRQNLAGKLLNHLAVFFINAMIVRILGPGQSGSFFNQLYLFNFCALILSLGLDYSAIKWLSGKPLLQKAVFNMLLKISIFAFLLLLFIAFVFLPLIPYNPEQPFWAVLLFISGNLMLILFQGMLSAMQRFNLQNLTLLFTNAIFVFFLLIVSKFKTNALHWVSAGYSLLFFIQGFLMMLFSFKSGKAKAEIEFRPFLWHGVRIMVSSLVYFCFLRIDNFFVEKYCNAITLSNYVQCGKIGQYFLYFSTVVSSTLLPFIASQQLANTYEDWIKMMRPYFLILLSASFLLAILGPYAYSLIFGNSFSGMQPFMLILLPGYVCLGMLTLTNAVYLGKGNIKRIFRGDVLGLIFVLSMDSLLIQSKGAIAAAVISSTGYILVFLYLWRGVKDQFVSN